MITAKNIGKKFGRTWIFRNLNFEIQTGSKVAITGKNGSGKSTLLQILSGYGTPTEGEITYYGQPIDFDKLSNVHIGPYTEIIEEYTLNEFLSFHSQFKKPTIPIKDMAQCSSLPLDKPISDFSTGMKQRAKLCTAFFFENNFIFMDEPTSNLDEEGFNWWKTELGKLEAKTVLLASNQANEINTTSKKVELSGI
ncbi:MAG: ABC transporter ATP-binding protein [Ekhidna sp.]